MKKGFVEVRVKNKDFSFEEFLYWTGKEQSIKIL
jgi:hypothetical protein